MHRRISNKYHATNIVHVLLHMIANWEYKLACYWTPKYTVLMRIVETTSII
jgi:hypothetical protein